MLQANGRRQRLVDQRIDGMPSGAFLEVRSPDRETAWSRSTCSAAAPASAF